MKPSLSIYNEGSPFVAHGSQQAALYPQNNLVSSLRLVWLLHSALATVPDGEIGKLLREAVTESNIIRAW